MKDELLTAATAVARVPVMAVRRPLGKRRLRKAVARNQGPLKISVGSAHVELPGWISTDITWQSRHYLDLTEPWDFAPHGVDFVYGDNVIEHLPLPLVRQALLHMRSALKPGGAVRLVTPDAERTARAYLDDPELTEQHLDRHRRHGYRDVFHPVDILRITFTKYGHHAGYIFDEASMRAELERAGFVDIVRSEVGTSERPEFKGLERRAEPTEAATALAMEAAAPR